jgi:hypothetical protein
LVLNFLVQGVFNISHLLSILSSKSKVCFVLGVLEVSLLGFTILLELWDNNISTALSLATEPMATPPAMFLGLLSLNDFLWVAGKSGLVKNWLWDNLDLEVNLESWVKNSGDLGESVLHDNLVLTDLSFPRLEGLLEGTLNLSGS